MSNNNTGAAAIRRNKAPRVQIQYETRVGDAIELKELPFVMGVMADLTGDTDAGDVTERGFVQFDANTFDTKMAAMKPSVKLSVPNMLTGEGNLSVELDFESMDDFSPGAVAQKVDSLNKLLEDRSKLKTLLSRMDGKRKVEDLLAELLANNELLQALAQDMESEDEGSN